jgi:hypothetical protein
MNLLSKRGNTAVSSSAVDPLNQRIPAVCHIPVENEVQAEQLWRLLPDNVINLQQVG